MADTQEIQQMYDNDNMIQTLHALSPLAESIGLMARERAIADGQNRTWVNSEVGKLASSRVANLIFLTAAKTGTCIDLSYIEQVGFMAIPPDLDDDFKGDSNLSRLSSDAVWNVQDQIREEHEDKGNRVQSAPVTNAASRAVALSVNLIEALGGKVDPEAFVATIELEDEEELRWVATRGPSNAKVAMLEDARMEPIMKMLAKQEVRPGKGQPLESYFAVLDGRHFESRHEFEKAVVDLVVNPNITDLPIGFSYKDAIDGARRHGWLKTSPYAPPGVTIELPNEELTEEEAEIIQQRKNSHYNDDLDDVMDEFGFKGDFELGEN